MKTLLAIAALLALTSSVQAQDHDCRIHHIDIRATRRADTLILRALYFGFDGQPLAQGSCPDQNGPTWSSEPDRQIIMPDTGVGFRVTMENPTGQVMTIGLATSQKPDKSFYIERRFRF